VISYERKIYKLKKKMEDELKCAICLDIAENAVETSCCHHIYCQECLQEYANNQVFSTCPECRSLFNILPSQLARRMIGNLLVCCPYEGCDSQITRSNVEDHKLLCQYRDIKCTAPNCQFDGNNEAFLNHLVSVHKKDLLKNSQKLFSFLDEIDSSPASTNKSKLDPIIERNNSRGYSARLGYTGKYYCGRSLDFTCSCCNRNCGPGNGCNCTGCMKLDIEARKLPKGFLVNREGFVCRKGTTGQFYCGRKMQTYDPRLCDGYCGPTNGPSCGSCRIINSISVYHSL